MLLCSGEHQQSDTSKRRRKREPLDHEESGGDQTLETSPRTRIRGKKTIAENAFCLTPHALLPRVHFHAYVCKNDWECLGMFQNLSEEHKQKLRRSLWRAKNKMISLFKRYKGLKVGGDQLMWPVYKDEQTLMLRTVTRKLYDRDANDAGACPFRRGAAMDYLASSSGISSSPLCDVKEKHVIKTAAITGNQELDAWAANNLDFGVIRSLQQLHQEERKKLVFVVMTKLIRGQITGPPSIFYRVASNTA